VTDIAKHSSQTKSFNMRFHWQNLNEKKVANKTVMGLPRRGRLWLYLATRWFFRAEWSIPGNLRISYDQNDEELSFCFGLILCTLYFSFPRPSWWSSSERGFSVYWYEKGLWLHPWGSTMEWRSKDPWWAQMYVFRPLDLIFGQHRYLDQILSTKDVIVPMPEKAYPATLVTHWCTWKRQRWPWWPMLITQVRYDVQIPGGIPIPGKGESEYDCQDTATMSLWTTADSEEQAICKVVENCLTTRRKYGGQHLNEPTTQKCS